MSKCYSFSEKGLKINKDQQKDLQKDLNRKASSELKKSLRIQTLENQINAINVRIDGMNGLEVQYKSESSFDKRQKIYSEIKQLKQLRCELKEKVYKLRNPEPKDNKTKVIKLAFKDKSNQHNMSGDSANVKLSISHRDTDNDSGVIVKESNLGKRSEISASNKTATISKVANGKTCKAKREKTKYINAANVSESKAVERVFNERTDIPKNSEMQHMSNSEYVRHINEPQREADIMDVMAQPEKGTTKKQGGSPNSGYKPRFIRQSERTRLLKAGVSFKPIGKD